MRDTFFRTHWRGFYFRVLGYGLVVNVTARPLFGLRTKGRHIGPVWWRWLKPVQDGAHYVRGTLIDGSWCEVCLAYGDHDTATHAAYRRTCLAEQDDGDLHG